LQRAPARAAIYGWAKTAGAVITVHFRGKAYETTVAGNGTNLGALMWRVELPPTPSSTTPENISVTGLGATLMLANVLFGDVWMCGGQSNVGVPLDETFDWSGIANDTNYPIHVMDFPHVTGVNSSTLHVGSGTFHNSPGVKYYVGNGAPIPWLPVSNHFSAICYYFGRALYKRMAAEGDVVPIGLVSNHWGGSMIESWVPETNAATDEVYCTDRKSRVGRTPGKLFNSMIMPVTNATIKGWFWYQGEQVRSFPTLFHLHTSFPPHVLI
jgi:sialate O-acetylesterase